LRLEANGYEVICASDGIEGLEKARRDNPDLIILDLMLPKMDGYSVCRLLKFDAKYKKIPIMLFSSRAQQSDLTLGEEVGADDYLIKPFDAHIFLTRIEALLK
jgi:DNA-binding response OmpR family regulator